MGDLSKELDFDFKRNSSLVLCFAEEDRPALQALYERGVANGVPDISILTGDEVRKMEPNVSGGGCGSALCTDRRHRMSIWSDDRAGRECL